MTAESWWRNVGSIRPESALAAEPTATVEQPYLDVDARAGGYLRCSPLRGSRDLFAQRHAFCVRSIAAELYPTGAALKFGSATL